MVKLTLLYVAMFPKKKQSDVFLKKSKAHNFLPNGDISMKLGGINARGNIRTIPTGNRLSFYIREPKKWNM